MRRLLEPRDAQLPACALSGDCLVLRTTQVKVRFGRTNAADAEVADDGRRHEMPWAR
jgi:hypothetical protein